jgi:hypothetical protein
MLPKPVKPKQGCQMADFGTQNINLGKFFRVVKLKAFYILWPLGLFGIFCGHLLYFMVILYSFLPFWYIVPRKSGNPESKCSRACEGLKNVANKSLPHT